MKKKLFLTHEGFLRNFEFKINRKMLTASRKKFIKILPKIKEGYFKYSKRSINF